MFVFAPTTKIFRRVCGCLSLTVAVTFNVCAQVRGWLWQNPLPQGNAIYAVRFASDKRHGWAVGSDGSIFATTDGGRTWRAQTSGVRAHLYSVAFADERVGVVVGDRGTLLVTADGGATWQNKSLPNGLPLTGAAFAAATKRA